MSKKYLAIILCMSFFLGMSGCARISSDKLVELKNEGYSVSQVDDDLVCITEGGVDYYFKAGIERPQLKTIILNVPSPNENTRKAGYQVTVTMVRRSFNRITLLFDNPRVRKDPDGKEQLHSNLYRFEFEGGFSEEHLTNNRGFHDVARDYRFFRQVLSCDEIQKIYDRGLELERML